MDLINFILNVLIPPPTFFILTHWLPPLFRAFLSYLITFTSFFSQNVAGKVVVITGASSGIGEASKAAISQFFETLRVEFGSDIGITVVSLGLVESEMTQGKFIGKDGGLQLDPEMRDVMMSITPMATADSTTKAIVKAACQGQKYLIEPAWYNYTYLLNALWPELLQYSYRFFYFTGTSPSTKDSLSKKLLDYSGAKSALSRNNTISSSKDSVIYNV